MKNYLILEKESRIGGIGKEENVKINIHFKLVFNTVFYVVSINVKRRKQLRSLKGSSERLTVIKMSNEVIREKL